MYTLDAEIDLIVRGAHRRLHASRRRSLPTREEQLRMEFALSLVEFLPSGVNLMTYDLSTNPHLPFILSDDEPWKCALAGEAADAETLTRHLPGLALDPHFEPFIDAPEWAAA
jgi:hypothetical protein